MSLFELVWDARCGVAECPVWDAGNRRLLFCDINGKKIHNLEELAKTFSETPERFVIKMIGDGPPLVLDPKQVEAARDRIKKRYNVMAEQNLEEQPMAKAPDDQKKS